LFLRTAHFALKLNSCLHTDVPVRLAQLAEFNGEQCDQFIPSLLAPAAGMEKAPADLFDPPLFSTDIPPSQIPGLAPAASLPGACAPAEE
jgi:hypothetical protein